MRPHRNSVTSTEIQFPNEAPFQVARTKPQYTFEGDTSQSTETPTVAAKTEPPTARQADVLRGLLRQLGD